MSKLNELKNALKVLEDAGLDKTILDAVRHEVVVAEDVESADEKVKEFRAWKLRELDCMDEEFIRAWDIIGEDSRNSWRKAYKAYSGYFGDEKEPYQLLGPFQVYMGGNERFMLHEDGSILVGMGDDSIAIDAIPDQDLDAFADYVTRMVYWRKKSGAQGA